MDMKTKKAGRWIVALTLSTMAASSWGQEFQRLPGRADLGAFEGGYAQGGFVQEALSQGGFVQQRQAPQGFAGAAFAAAGNAAFALKDRFGRAVQDASMEMARGDGWREGGEVRTARSAVAVDSGPVRELRRVPRVAEPADLAELAARVAGPGSCIVWVGPNFGLGDYASLTAGTAEAGSPGAALARFASNLRGDFAASKSAQKRDLGSRYKISADGADYRIEPEGYAGPGADEMRRMCVR